MVYFHIAYVQVVVYSFRNVHLDDRARLLASEPQGVEYEEAILAFDSAGDEYMIPMYNLQESCLRYP